MLARARRARRQPSRSASPLEYGLLAAAIAAVLVVLLITLGGLVRDVFSESCGGKSGGTSASSNC